LIPGDQADHPDMPAMAEMQPAVIVWDFNSAPVPTRLISRFVKKVSA
jgi:hypothetical protein